MSKTYENIQKIHTGKGDDYTIGCLLDYPYFKENYKMIAIIIETVFEFSQGTVKILWMQFQRDFSF